MMKKLLTGLIILFGLLVLMGLMGLVCASDFTPQGDINLREVYAIKDATTINATGNISTAGWFEGLFNWTVVSNFLSFDGSTLTLNDTQLNESINSSIDARSGSINVNSSDYWDDLNTINATQMENSGGTLNILESWLSSLYCKLTGCTMTGNLNMSNNDITNVGNLTLQGFTNGSVLYIDEDGRIAEKNDFLYFESNGTEGKLGVGSSAQLRNIFQAIKEEGLTDVDDVKALIAVVNTGTTDGTWAGFSWQTIDTEGDRYSGARIMTEFTNHSAASVSGDMVFDTRHEGTRSEKMRLTSEGNLNMSGGGNITAENIFGNLDGTWNGSSNYFTKADITGFGYWNNTWAGFNKTYADLLYSTIDEPLWSANYSAYNSSWSSTYNSTYDATTSAWDGNWTNIETLTDNSMADTLHRHSELSASDGDPDAVLAIDAAGTTKITQTGTTGNGMWVYRNLASASTNSPLVFIEQDNAGDDQPALNIQQDGSNYGLYVNSNAENTKTYDNRFDGASTESVIGGFQNGTGRAGYFYRNQVLATTDKPVVEIRQDNAGDDQNVLDVNNDGTGNGLFIDQNGNGIALNIDNAGTSAGLVVDGAGTGYSAIFNNGNVGIGTTTPGQKLEVAGTINATAFKLQDSNKLYLGSADDVSMTMNGTTFNILDEVGSIVFNFLGFLKYVFDGDVEVTGDLEVENLLSTDIYDITDEGMVLGMNFNSENINGNTVLDSSGENNHGTNNGATHNSSGGFNDGGAYEFDGVNDEINMGDVSDVEGIDDLSLSLWIKIINNSEDGKLISKGSYFTSPSSFAMIYSGVTKRISFSVSNSRYRWISFTLTNNQWYHLTGVYSNSSNFMKIYINGVEPTGGADDGTFITIPDNSYDLLIGNDNTSLYFNGTIDDVRIYNRSLSADEIKALYNQRSEVKDSYVSQKDVQVDDGNLNITSGNLIVQGNVTLLNGGKLWDNSTCTFISSPDGSTVQEVCNA